jgi:deoxyadenosine/deoxycytidine kinase
MRITVVGPCASGKTALAERLQKLGYEARECVQEHSYVPTMWQRISQPDVLIYLDASLAVVAERRAADWSEEYLAKLNRRLSHARQHCDLYVQTDGLSEEEVLERALDFLRAFPLPRREGPGEGESSS